MPPSLRWLLVRVQHIRDSMRAQDESFFSQKKKKIQSPPKRSGVKPPQPGLVCRCIKPKKDGKVGCDMGYPSFGVPRRPGCGQAIPPRNAKVGHRHASGLTGLPMLNAGSQSEFTMCVHPVKAMKSMQEQGKCVSGFFADFCTFFQVFQMLISAGRPASHQLWTLL